MSTWHIPAKTFLLGEYAAVNGDSAILVTTSPCFTLTQRTAPASSAIHPESPAGLWWAQHGSEAHVLEWHDPYDHIGGIGASSAQFIGTFLATCELHHHTPSLKLLLDAYYQSAWRGDGLKPSGYDVLAQTQNQCVFIHRNEDRLESFPWPFDDIGFILVHSGEKLATHYHLRQATLPASTTALDALVRQAKTACEHSDSALFIDAVHRYHCCLLELQLVARHTQQIVDDLHRCYPILAAKGCGAMGADVILLLAKKSDINHIVEELNANQWKVLATEACLNKKNALFENNIEKTLEILP